MRKKQKKSIFKKISSSVYLLVIAMIAMLPLLRYTPVTDKADLHKSAPEYKLTVNLPFENVPYVIFNSDNNQVVARDSGFTKNFDLPNGIYRIEFSQINGYESPKPQKFAINGTAKITISGKYTPTIGYPLLGLKVFPDNAKYVIYDSHGKKVAEGTGSQFFQMPNGNYSVEFLAIPGFHSPGKNNFYLANGVTTTVIAAYGQ
jgi:hypothetical protein